MESIENLPVDPSLDMTKRKKPKSYLLPLSIGLFITILGSAYIVVKVSSPQLFSNSSTSSVTPSPVPTRSPYPLKADLGTAGTFNISQSHKIGPIFTKFVIDPIVPQTLKDIKITLTLKSDLEISSLTAKITGDKDPIPLEMTKVSRVNNIETWSSTFKLTQPVDYNYIFNFTANDGTNNIVFDLPLRTD